MLTPTPLPLRHCLSHELVVLSDGLGYLGFGDSDGLHGQPWAHGVEVRHKCSPEVLVNLVCQGKQETVADSEVLVQMQSSSDLYDKN